MNYLQVARAMYDFQETVKHTDGEWHVAHREVKHVSPIRFFNSASVVAFLKQCIIKQLLDSVFVISGIIKVPVSVISLCLGLWVITLTSTLIIPDITKTSSNNFLLFIVQIIH